jgi:hypothetical protein
LGLGVGDLYLNGRQGEGGVHDGHPKNSAEDEQCAVHGGHPVSLPDLMVLL